MSLNRRQGFHRRRMGNRDANHAAIVEGLRKLGHHVIDLAGAGDGVPDLCVYPRATWSKLGPNAEALAAWPVPTWLELKVAKGSVRASQAAWALAALNAGIRVAVVRSLDEALRALGGEA